MQLDNDELMERHLVQGSPEWLEFRKKSIGASDAPVIMGVSPWSTPFKLWQNKLGMTEVKQNFAMKRGHDLEPMIRQEFELRAGVNVEPAVVIHPVFPWMIASLDGLNRGEKVVVEIKTANEKDHELVKTGKVPDKYYPQLQHQLACLDYNSVHYFSYHKDDYALVIVDRDDEYIQQLYKKEEAFFKCMMSLTPPEMTEGDYTERTDAWWWGICDLWTKAEKEAKKWTEAKDQYKKLLIEGSDGLSSKGGGVTLRYFPASKGPVNYKKIPELKGVDLEQYRGTKKEYWRLTPNDNSNSTNVLP